MTVLAIKVTYEGLLRVDIFSWGNGTVTKNAFVIDFGSRFSQLLSQKGRGVLSYQKSLVLGCEQYRIILFRR